MSVRKLRNLQVLAKRNVERCEQLMTLIRSKITDPRCQTELAAIIADINRVYYPSNYSSSIWLQHTRNHLTEIEKGLLCRSKPAHKTLSDLDGDRTETFGLSWEVSDEKL